MSMETANEIKREIIPFTTEAAWLDARSQDLTSTEIPALFGLSPYTTYFELWHRKKTGDKSIIQENERMKWGKRLEPVTAAGLAEDNGWAIKPFKDYIRLPGLRLGSSFDFKLDIAVLIPFEIKTVDGRLYKTWWNKDNELEAPFHIELQVQHQMLVSGAVKAKLGVLFGGNEAYVLDRDYNPEIGQLILKKAAEFWQSIDENKAPKPDYESDAEFIKELYATATEGKVLDASGDAELTTWAGEYLEMKKEIAFLTEQCKAKQAQIIERIKDAETVLGNGFKISAKVQKKKAYAVAASECRVIRISGSQTQE